MVCEFHLNKTVFKKGRGLSDRQVCLASVEQTGVVSGGEGGKNPEGAGFGKGGEGGAVL